MIVQSKQWNIQLCHSCVIDQFLFLCHCLFSISCLILLVDHINPLSAICLTLEMHAQVVDGNVLLFKHWTSERERKSSKHSRKREIIFKWKMESLYISEEKEINLYWISFFLSLWRWSDEYGHLFPSSITDGWIMTKKRKRKAQ